MSELDLSMLWPEWECVGCIGEGTFGKVYLVKAALESGEAYGTVKVISIPANDETVQGALDLGVSEDLLKTYFGKFKNDLNWELTMFKSVSAPSIDSNDEIALIDNPNGFGWKGYIRTGVYTPADDYFAKHKSTPDDAVRMGKDIADAVGVYGSYGMSHGDIRPGNIMVKDSGGYVVTDFGISRCLKRAGSRLFREHDERYDAPEVTEAGKYTNASDIYSLGMTLMYFANGGVLPEKNDPDNIKGISTELSAVIKKAVQKNPMLRYQSAAELKADLEAVPVHNTNIRRAAAIALALEKANKSAEPAAENVEPAAPIKEPEKEKKGKGSSVIAGLFVCAVIAAALFITKPWELLPGKDPVDPDVDPGPQFGDTTDPGPGDNTPDDPTPDDPTPDNPIPDDPTPVDPGPGDNTPDDPTPDDPTPDDPEPIVPDDRESTVILPSNERELTRADLDNMTRDETYMALNEIYARHGKIFTTSSIQSYFERQAWYTPVSKDSADALRKLSSLERANLDFIIAYQREKGYR